MIRYSIMSNILKISPNINAEIVHCAPFRAGTDLYRVIIEFLATKPSSEAGKLFKEYEIWFPIEVVEDSLRLPKGAKFDDIVLFVENVLKNRFEKSENKIPEEGGILFKSMYDTVIGNPNTFPFKLDNKTKLLKTTIMLPEDTREWLKTYGTLRNVGLGEAIRRVVSDFQAGTVSRESVSSVPKVQNTGGVADPNSKN